MRVKLPLDLIGVNTAMASANTATSIEEEVKLFKELSYTRLSRGVRHVFGIISSCYARAGSFKLPSLVKED